MAYGLKVVKNCLSMITGNFLVKGISTLLYLVNSVFFYTFVAAGRQRLVTGVWCVMIALSALCGLFLIPEYGLMAAAASYVISIAGGTVVYLIMTRRAPGISLSASLAEFFLEYLPVPSLCAGKIT